MRFKIIQRASAVHRVVPQNEGIGPVAVVEGAREPLILLDVAAQPVCVRELTVGRRTKTKKLFIIPFWKN